MRAVSGRPGPVDLVGRMELGQQQRVQLIPHASLGPVAQPAPARHARPVPELLGQIDPGHAGQQHEQDAVQAGAVIQRQPPRPARASRPDRQQRLDPRPQLVADFVPGHGHARLAELVGGVWQPRRHWSHQQTSHTHSVNTSYRSQPITTITGPFG
jgi:hypothetical protein